ncbi:MAG TPA: hypothetical protein VJN88_00530 [Ktedonobacterales bacterium]|nr:hypothetical protein [Ktedonobacterales bacterium]
MAPRHSNALALFACAALALFALGVSGPLYATLTHSNLGGAVFVASVLTMLWGALACGASWLLGLSRAARERQWDWFVVVLALGPLGTLLYGLRTTATGVEAY